MNQFQHINPPDIQTAAALLQEPGTAAIAGGTDLITELKKRSWYYRHPQLQCWLKGGKTCYARQGLHRHHAVFGNSPCVAVNPSDLAPALIALDATVKIAKADGTHQIPIESLYRLPDPDHRLQTTLSPGDIIIEISIPKKSKAFSAIYLKLMERAAWSFALVSVAVAMDWKGGCVKQARIIFGGVAGTPWRVHEAEKLLHGQKIKEMLTRFRWSRNF